MRLHLFFLSLLIANATFAQDIVDINLNMKHSVNGVSQFDREKYMIIHDGIDGNEWISATQKRDFLEGYDVYFGRNNGAMVWNWNQTTEDPSKPGWPSISNMIGRGKSSISSYASRTADHKYEDRLSYMMFGGQEHIFPHGQKNAKGWVYDGHAATAEFYAQYYNHFFGTGGRTGHPKPLMLEVCNEPFVKAGDLGVTKRDMAEFHSVVAKRVRAVNPNVLVGGYSAAHPMFEAGNFNLWNETWKMFIDVAGADMDYFSFHIYDGNSKLGQGSQYKRAGANLEAIMDMINHYSTIKLGKTVPFSVSEYGDLPCKACKDDAYHFGNDWYNVRSFNNIMMQFLERPDQILNAIPFALVKANWAKPAGAEYNNYSSRLLREIGELPGEKAHGGWMYTGIRQYFQLWSNVNGTRIDTKSVDPDLQVDAYVDGKKLYLILNNLNWEERTVALNFIDTKNNTVTKIEAKRSYKVDNYNYLGNSYNDVPRYDTLHFDGPISTIDVASEGTVLLEYTFENDVVIDAENTENTYFANKYLQEIATNTPISFTLNGVVKDQNGEAILRLGLGRDHNKSLQPKLTINGSEVDVPNDWRGYDQKSRDRFFGVIEVPVPFDVLQENNAIELTFNDAGGHVTSMALQVWNMSKAVVRSKKQLVGIKVTPSEKHSKENKTFQLSWKALPEEYNDSVAINWISSDTTLATVDENGWVITLANGIVNIIAKDSISAKEGICKLQISDDAPAILATSLNITKENAALKNPGILQLYTEFEPSDVDVKEVLWTTQDSAIATVDADGLVTAVSVGKTTIYATTIDGSNISSPIEISVPAFSDRVFCPEISNNIRQADEFSFSIPYATSKQKDILVTISGESGFTAIAETRVTIDAAIDTITVTIPFEKHLDVGSYKLWTRLIPVGGKWYSASSTCTETIEVKQFTGITPIVKNEIKLYPNPTSKGLQISGLLGVKHQIKVFGIDGTLYLQLNSNKKQVVSLSMETLNAGYYIVQIIGDDFISSHRISKK